MKFKYSIILVGYLMLYSLSGSAFAQQDSALNALQEVPVMPRQFSADTLQQLADSDAFNYFQEKAKTYSLLDQIGYWIADMLDALFSTRENRSAIRYFIYGIAAIIISFIVMKLMGIEPTQGIYRRATKHKIDAKIIEEELELEDFPAAIQSALQKNDYRLAVRYSYLFLLKKMDEKAVIEWNEHKTNHELELEVTEPSLRKDFEKATYVFERIYYGAFQIEPALYEKAKATFDTIDQKLVTL